MDCPKCKARLRVYRVVRVSARLTVRYLKCSDKKCKQRVKSTETY